MFELEPWRLLIAAGGACLALAAPAVGEWIGPHLARALMALSDWIGGEDES